MSVTFTLEANPTGAFTAHCYDDNVTLGPVESYDAILPVLAIHKAQCEECAAYGIYSQPVMDVSDDFDLNVSSMNGRILLDALGVHTPELWGALSGEDFLGRVLLAIAADRDDSGVDSAVIGGASLGQTGATMIDCGLRPGYFADRFGALHALGMEAVRLGREVHWS